MAEFDIEKYRSIGVNTKKRQWGRAVNEFHTSEGIVKKTKDELGNVVTERPGDKQDVHIFPKSIQVSGRSK